MKTITKALAATVAAGAMAVTSATPAMARHKDRGIDAGDIIAGALIIGGIAAVASAAGKDRRHSGYRDRDYRGQGYNSNFNRNSSRRAVERCVRAAENRAQRRGFRYADVTQIRDVDDTRYGWKVKGRLVVDGARGYRDRDYRGYRNTRSDRGKFTCYVERGRIAELRYSGIRGL